ncbi:MAG: hypothetical protein NTZ13_01330 [Candidatus Parcubacteria bacterium]|nr:hypothetical protein [Candidatus Parcubacteria bacterium]
MIFIKDCVTRQKFIELVEFSLAPECQFLIAVKPKTNIVNDHLFQNGSIISFLKVEEHIFEDVDAQGLATLWAGFSVKILVEDEYWVKKEKRYYKSEITPPEILNKVAEILSR